MELRKQTWAMTGSRNSVADLKDDFYTHCDMGGCIDAPQAVPGGSTVENVLTRADDLNGRYIIGGISWR